MTETSTPKLPQHLDTVEDVRRVLVMLKVLDPKNIGITNGTAQPFIDLMAEVEALRAYKAAREKADAETLPESIEGVRQHLLGEIEVNYALDRVVWQRERRSHRRHIRALQKAVTQMQGMINGMWQQMSKGRQEVQQQTQQMDWRTFLQELDKRLPIAAKPKGIFNR